MKNDNRLWRTLHVLIHMGQQQGPLTSAEIAQMLKTNPVVVRRTLAGLRDRGYIQAEKGHGGGWQLKVPLEQISLRDVYEALGEPPLISLGPNTDARVAGGCLVEAAVNQALDEVLQQARQLLLARFGQISVAQIEADFQGLMAALPEACAHATEH